MDYWQFIVLSLSILTYLLIFNVWHSVEICSGTDGFYKKSGIPEKQLTSGKLIC